MAGAVASYRNATLVTCFFPASWYPMGAKRMPKRPKLKPRAAGRLHTSGCSHRRVLPNGSKCVRSLHRRRIRYRQRQRFR